MQRDYNLYLEDILEAINKIERYSRDISYAEFLDSELVIDGIIRNLEIIGEAIKEIPQETKDKYPDIDWKRIIGLRDIVAHRYFGIDTEIIWDIIKNKISELKKCVKEILESLNKKRKK